MLYLFDIDGTILLTGGAGSRALNAVFFSRFGVERAMDGVSVGGKTDPDIISEMFQNRLNRNPDPHEIDQVLEAYVPLLQIEIRRSKRFRLMPHVVETLDFLAGQPNVLLAIATGNIRTAAEAKLSHANLSSRFAVGGYGDDSRIRASLIQHAIERARDHSRRKFDADQIVVVGDTVRDIDAARAVGVRVLAVATGQCDRESLRQADPDGLFDTLAELPNWHSQNANASALPSEYL